MIRSMFKKKRFLKKLKDVLENGKPVRSLDLDDEEKIIVKDAFLITMKPDFICCKIFLKDDL